MRTTPTCTYDPPDLIPTAWPINFWFIYTNTPVLSPLLITNVSNIKHAIVTTELKTEATIEAAYKCLLATSALGNHESL